MLKSQFSNHPDREPANRNFFDNDFEPIRFSVNSMTMKPIKSQQPISESFVKTHKMTHADIGQLDMYVRMYDDLIKNDDDNPTIGVLLCTDTDSTIAKYSVLNESQQLFASKYMPFMPTEEELRHEIEQQKRFFLEHHKG